MSKIRLSIYALALIIITYLFVFIPPRKAKAIENCGAMLVNCMEVHGIQPTATCTSTNNTDRDTGHTWSSGQTTNSLWYYTGDSLYITLATTPSNASGCDGASHKVATLRCLNYITGYSSTVDLYMPACVYSAKWTLEAHCYSTTCSVNATIDTTSFINCPATGPCAE